MGIVNYCYIIQCNEQKIKTDPPSYDFMKKKKEKEWELNSTNRGKIIIMNSTQLVGYWLCEVVGWLVF